MGTNLSLLQKPGKGRRRLGWQMPETTATETTASARDSDTPNKVPPTLNSQRPQSSQKPSQDQYMSQSKSHKQWEAEMKTLNAKYNLDCFSDSKLDLESDDGEQYKYEHGYETLI